MKKVITKKEMIESFANTEAQKRVFYYRYKKVRKPFVKQCYTEYICGEKSRSSTIHQMDRYLLRAYTCVKHA